MPKYIITLTDEEQKVLEHDLLDVKAWIEGAVNGKIHNCLSRAVNEFRLKTSEKEVPSDLMEAFNLYSSQPEYKNREQREEQK